MYQNRGTLSTAWLRPEPLGAYNAGLKRGTAREGREEEGKKRRGRRKGEGRGDQDLPKFYDRSLPLHCWSVLLNAAVCWRRNSCYLAGLFTTPGRSRRTLASCTGRRRNTLNRLTCSDRSGGANIHCCGIF